VAGGWRRGGSSLRRVAEISAIAATARSTAGSVLLDEEVTPLIFLTY
jgi:hypothetical protein